MVSKKINSDLIYQQEEAKFLDDEIFVSRTDLKGIILEGNSVFARISEFSIDELIGSPHNIIRHPDMPKCVFKLLWNRIKNRQVTVAYVKNQSRNGKFYWVLACVFIEEGGYFSIRIKPQSKLKSIAEQIYIKLLEVEKDKGVDKASEFLMQELKSLGIHSYDQFMTSVLKEELNLRIKNRGQSPSVTKLKSNNEIFEQNKNLIILNLERSFRSIKQIIKNTESSKFEEFLAKSNVNSFDRISDRIEVLSVNMCITANKLSREGSALYVVANTFQATSHKFLKTFLDFKKSYDSMKMELQSNYTDIYYAFIQVEMLHSSVKNETYTSMGELFSKNNYLFDATLKFFTKTEEKLASFMKLVDNTNRLSKSLIQHLTRIDLIKTGGKIEGSRTDSLISVFGPFINEMEKFVDEYRDSMEGIEVFVETTYKLVSEMLPVIRNINYLINESMIHFKDSAVTVIDKMEEHAS